MGWLGWVQSGLLILIIAPPSIFGAKVCNDGKFGPFIEGAAVNRAGDVFAVNGAYARNTISRASGTCDTFATVNDKPNTELNSIRVLPDGRMLSTDTKNQRVVLVSADGRQASTYCEGGGMVLPNDLALSRAGLLYISGQRWTDNTAVGDGGVWLCRGPGQGQQLTLLGRTNGIELSPDDKYLYVSEAYNKGGVPVSNKILRYTLNPDGTLGSKTTFYDFATDGSANVDIDGMRTDTAGNLYVTRNQVVARSSGAQQVVQLSPAGKILKIFQLPFSSPTNLELGGSDGKTLYVVGRCGIDTQWGTGTGCVESFRVEGPPGRAWKMLQDGLPAVSAAKNAAAKAQGNKQGSKHAQTKKKP